MIKHIICRTSGYQCDVMLRWENWWPNELRAMSGTWICLIWTDPRLHRTTLCKAMAWHVGFAWCQADICLKGRNNPLRKIKPCCGGDPTDCDPREIINSTAEDVSRISRCVGRLLSCIRSKHLKALPAKGPASGPLRTPLSANPCEEREGSFREPNSDRSSLSHLDDCEELPCALARRKCGKVVHRTVKWNCQAKPASNSIKLVAAAELNQVLWHYMIYIYGAISKTGRALTENHWALPIQRKIHLHQLNPRACGCLSLNFPSDIIVQRKEG